MPAYDPFFDYSEMMIQFGYVTFFSMAFPLAPLCALLNNVIEIRTDAYKLCHNTQRPVARKASGIGVWFKVLEFMSLIAVLTNLAHIGFTSDQFSHYFPSITNAEKIFIIFCFEHIILGLEWVINATVPSSPAWVRKSILRDEYIRRERHHKEVVRMLQASKDEKAVHGAPSGSSISSSHPSA